MGCVSTAEQPPAATGGWQTASIDPAYSISPERKGAGERTVAEELSLEYVREAAAIAMREGQVCGAAVHLSKVYDAEPTDKKLAYDYARHLRYCERGFLPVAEQVLTNALAVHSVAPLLRLELSKVHIAKGEPDRAIAILKPLSQQFSDDPSVWQAYGVALDRRGTHAEAQRMYERAIALDRPSASLLNNAGMSYLLSGNLAKAETLLRRATVAHGAGPQTRQNLALVLGLQNKTAEAKEIARQIGPTEITEAPVAYAESLTARRHPWSIAVTQ